MKIYQEARWEWLPWFAWRPVRTENMEWVWFEIILRKLTEAKIPNVQPSSWVIYKRK
jgi:hypothetical protein